MDHVSPIDNGRVSNATANNVLNERTDNDAVVVGIRRRDEKTVHGNDKTDYSLKPTCEGIGIPRRRSN
jgi:hypothetical protein